MDEAIELVQDFARAEYDAYQDSYLEKDAAEFGRKKSAAEAFFHVTPDSILSLEVGHDPAAAQTDAQREQAAKYAARTVLLVRHYRNERFGDLYAVYVTSARKRPRVRYGDILYVAKVDGAWKIVSRYTMGMPTDGPLAWEHAGGAEIGEPGELVETRRLQAPEVPEQLADYESG